MASPVPQGVPRPGFQRPPPPPPPPSLADQMQTLTLNRPQAPLPPSATAPSRSMPFNPSQNPSSAIPPPPFAIQSQNPSPNTNPSSNPNFGIPPPPFTSRPGIRMSPPPPSAPSMMANGPRSDGILGNSPSPHQGPPLAGGNFPSRPHGPLGNVPSGPQFLPQGPPLARGNTGNLASAPQFAPQGPPLTGGNLGSFPSVPPLTGGILGNLPSAPQFPARGPPPTGVSLGNLAPGAQFPVQGPAMTAGNVGNLAPGAQFPVQGPTPAGGNMANLAPGAQFPVRGPPPVGGSFGNLARGPQSSSQGMPMGSAPMVGSPLWQQTQGPSPRLSGPMQPPRMYGMPPSLPNQHLHGMQPGMGHPPGTGVLGMARSGSPVAGAPGAGASKIDPNQIPRPIPSSSSILFESHPNSQANLPPSAASNYIVKDYGNCSPRYIRSTIYQIPCTGDLLTTSSMPLALMIQPLALPHPSEEPIQVVDFGESGPVRCSRCKGYINPFMKFIDQGRRFICNLCGFTDETPRDYICNLGPDGRRRDADERPELCRGTVEFVATKEYTVREPMPAVFYFLVDVSLNAVQTGATAAACIAIRQAIADLPEGPRTFVGIATFDSTIHFYNLRRASQQPIMLIVPDVQDVYTPLQTDLVVQLTECREHLEQLLKSIPDMFQSNRVAESAFGAAIKGAFLALKPTGGKLLAFQSVLPSLGIGALSAREAEGRANVLVSEKEAHKLLQPADKTFKTMAIEFAEHQVCVDIFITAQSYVDIASISVVPITTGGQVYCYYPFSSISDSAKLYNDLRWNVTRPQGFEAVMRVRCSQGLQVQDYFGNFCKRIPTDVDLPGIDCDKTIMVTFKHDDKFQEGSECSFQSALLYTTVYGQRRIRISTLSLPCTSVLSNLFRAADLDAQFTCFLKQAANDIPTNPLFQVRDQITNLSINILFNYRKFCATVSSSAQLILPEALKLLPLYTLALLKSTGLQGDARIDDRSYWVNRATSLAPALAVPLIYPRMLAIHNLISKEEKENEDVLVNLTLPPSSEHITDDGVFLLENGEECLFYVGNMVNPDIVRQLFGVASVDDIPSQFLLQQLDNELSKKLNNIVNEIRRERCSYLRMKVCRKGEPSGMYFVSRLVEDKNGGSFSYPEFLVHIHKQIQNKMV
ncbi:protein transport protein Sec24-like At4g32640 [Amborella trichopoda]|uniref:protein transport protein Sec24-like At4g32640 n=1 Tax=Amborella trichopoda TaxID=13333 RepID=UPI0005D34539|nr:protein transport protein Sec24-like At4g32640 [Amborella trichopoda]|eukprot:XP_011628219.1 protein transport protein Sec24-like At4g32640 [Amborella trichopoda]